MPDGTLLKALLLEKRWQRYGTFRAEYEKAAQQLDQGLSGTYPGVAQYRRWLAGTLKTIPYPEHCRVLETMLPGYRAEQLFSMAASQVPDHPVPVPSAVGGGACAMPPVGLRPHIERAFAARHVSIDFAGFSSETLHGALQEPLDRVRHGQLAPESIAIRLLMSDPSEPFSVPCRIDDLADDPDFRRRAERIMTRHAGAIVDSVGELAKLGRLSTATALVRLHRCAPLFKLYIINGQQAFFGFYPIQEHAVMFGGVPHPMYDLMGKETMLFQHSRSADDPTGGQYIEQSQLWFDTMWTTVSREFTL